MPFHTDWEQRWSNRPSTHNVDLGEEMTLPILLQTVVGMLLLVVDHGLWRRRRRGLGKGCHLLLQLMHVSLHNPQLTLQLIPIPAYEQYKKNIDVCNYEKPAQSLTTLRDPTHNNCVRMHYTRSMHTHQSPAAAPQKSGAFRR